jgi:peptidoglycan-N-acetylglucosamine deacetylase
VGFASFTLDLEDHRTAHTQPARVHAVVTDLLEVLDRHAVIGTFFVVGSVAAGDPELVRAIAAAGHEIAFHGQDHRALDRVDPATYGDECARARSSLEELVQAPVVGYRAPIFSLTAATTWVVDALVSAGFTYSSSVMPARNPLYGFPSAPAHPFRWSNGLVELPCPVAGLLGQRIPCLGGVYLRVLPPAARRVLEHRLVDDQLTWLYCHPYDFDADEPYFAMDGFSDWTGRIMWVGRRRMLARVAGCLSGRTLVTMAAAAGKLSADGLPVVEPSSLAA